MEAASSSEASASTYKTLSQPRKLQSGQSKTSELTNIWHLTFLLFKSTSRTWYMRSLQNFNRKTISVTWGRRLKGNKIDFHGTGKSWDNLLNILTILRAGRSSNRVLISGRSREIFLFSCVQTASGIHPASYPLDTAISAEMKWPGREADQSPPSSAKDENEWRYATTPLHAFTVLTLPQRNVLWDCGLDPAIHIVSCGFWHRVVW